MISINTQTINENVTGILYYGGAIITRRVGTAVGGDRFYSRRGKGDSMGRAGAHL